MSDMVRVGRVRQSRKVVVILRRHESGASDSNRGEEGGRGVARTLQFEKKWTAIEVKKVDEVWLVHYSLKKN